MIINKALIPAAGRGSRLLNLTLTQPKELLPIVNQPAIDYIVDEAIGAGFKELCIITNEYKKPSLDKHLYEKNIDITYIYQRHPLGLGHAVYQAKEWCNNEGFAVILPDDIYSDSKLITRMVDYTERTSTSSLAIFPIEPMESSSYGVPLIENLDDMKISSIIEKPVEHKPEYRYGIMGRYVLTPTIWEYLDGEKIGAKGEIQLTDALDQMARIQGITGFEASGKKIDIGNQKGWLEANIYYAIREYGQEWVEKLVKVNSISKGKTE